MACVNLSWPNKCESLTKIESGSLFFLIISNLISKVPQQKCQLAETDQQNNGLHLRVNKPVLANLYHIISVSLSFFLSHPISHTPPSVFFSLSSMWILTLHVTLSSWASQPSAVWFYPPGFSPILASLTLVILTLTYTPSCMHTPLGL